MKNTNWFVSAIALLFFTSCANGSAENNSTTTNEVSTPAAPATTTDTMKSVWKDVNGTNSQANPTTSQPANQATTVALNPAHGQPNHRCDIEVGAPLNSPRQPVQQTLPSAITSPATGTQGSVKVNPPHGQPGHDCAVAVGAPLKAS